VLANAFQRYPSFQKSRVVRDSKTGKSKGYGFVSFKDPWDMTKALREMQGKYVGNRPIKVRKSTMHERMVTEEHKPLQFTHALSVTDRSTKRQLQRGGAIHKAPTWKNKPKKGMPW
jgi:RNA recognition motif-containing protein